MKAKGVRRFLCTIGVTALCVLGLTACSGGLTGGTAATVNGVAIPEDKVTTYIEQFRESYGLTKDSDWKNWMKSSGYTPESLRSAVIDIYVEQEAIKLAATERGISIAPDVIDGYVNDVKSKYSSDEEWKKALDAVGMSEDEYRENIERSLLAEDLTKAIEAETPASEEDQLLNYCNMYLNRFDGAKRSSHILFSSEDADTAKTVLEQLNDGSLDFETAAQTYSIDSSGADGGDVGWDKASRFITEYTDALDKLEVGEISGLVNSVYGIHIIKCTDKFTSPEKLSSIDEMPEGLVDYVRSTMTANSSSDALTTYLTAYVASLDVVENDIPKSVPYYVSL
ncbi:MAG: peptidylprolyl isomerase [Eggerthellaceae bacterium]|nr:peptidylprolyl isomerase [Eggerthellaceae bacterium]